jgi:hypothetical protein
MRSRTQKGTPHRIWKFVELVRIWGTRSTLYTVKRAGFPGAWLGYLRVGGGQQHPADDPVSELGLWLGWPDGA